MAGSVESACVLQVNNMNYIQRMIDINASNLDGLRTQCTTSSDLIQQEIRDQEAKLVKLFSRMLEARQQIEAQCTNYFDYHQYPRLEQWLDVVGIASCGVKAIVERYGSFGSLLAAPENQLRDVLVDSEANSEDAWKLVSALNHLRKFTERRREGRKDTPTDNKTNSNIYSWSYGKENHVQLNSTSSSSQSSIGNTDDAPSTPGPDLGVEQATSPRRSPKPVVMKRSKSEDLAGKPNIDPLPPGGSLGKNKGRNLWITIPHSGSVDHLNDENNHNNNLSSSPKTPTRINLGDRHKFSNKHMMIGSQCDFCKKQIFRGVKCKKCGLKFHRNCCKNGLPMYGCRFVHMARSMERNNKFYGSLPSRVRPKRANSEPSNINNSVETPRLPMNTSHGDLFQNTVYHRKRGFNEPPPSLSYAPHLFDSVFPIDTGSSSGSTPQPSPPPPYMSVPASAPPQGDYDFSDRRSISSRSFRRRKGLGVFNFEFLESRYLCEVVEKDESNQTSIRKDHNMTCRGLRDYHLEVGAVRDVINAVKAFAHALDSLQKELCPNQVGICPEMAQFHRRRLLEHLKNVSFLDPTVNAIIEFDENSEVSAMYDIMNFRKENGKARYVRVGTWDGKYVDNHIESKLELDQRIKWLQGISSAPQSYCSKNCSFDEIRVQMPSMDLKCCWKCKQCGKLQIVVNNTCQSGPIGWEPNANKTGWVKRTLVYPKWNESPSIMLILISVFSLVLTLLTVLMYIVYRENRLVKASGRELCFVMLAGIALCFTVPFLFIAKPKDELCYARGLVIGLALAMCYAPLFMKINRIYRIFTGAKSSVAQPPLVTPRMQLLITLALVVIQLMFTILWLTAKPVRATETYIASTEELVLECKVDELGFSVNLCYVMILMILCTAYAFKTRNFPKNFNESKYIGISMYITCAVWMVFFPFYFNTDHSIKHTYLISSACVIIGLVTLIGLFAQKAYIVFCVKNIRNDDLVFSHVSYRRERMLSDDSVHKAVEGSYKYICR